MDIYKIARKIALNEETAADLDLLKFIGPKLRERFDIDKNLEPIAKGQSNLVYENRRGNITTFISATGSAARSCDQALESVGKNSKILPEIFDLEYIRVKGRRFCVIEMEKLRVLSDEEEHDIAGLLCYDGETIELLSDLKKLLTEFDDPKLIAIELADRYYRWERILLYPDEDIEKVVERHIYLSENPMLDLVLELFRTMKQENIKHFDLSCQNVAWGRDGNLKLIDWEAISLS